jgi:hypothetical protein
MVRSLLFALLFGSAALLVYAIACAGCGTEAVVGPAPDGGGLVAAGAAAVARHGCPACHDPGDGSLSGQTGPRPGTLAYGRNLTPDPETGIGAWSDAAIARAIRGGVDDQLAPLCPPMPRFAGMEDGEVAAIVAYLRQLPPVRNAAIPESICPPLKGSIPDGGASDANPDEAAVADASSADRAIPPDESLAPDAAEAAGDAAEPIDLSAAPVDASRVADLAVRDLARSDGAVCACGPLLNEVQTAGAAGAADEFVEIYNPCASPVDFTGWRLVYRSAAGASDVVLVHLAGTLPPAKLSVCAGKSFIGPADARFSDGLAATGGGLALVDPVGAWRDSMGWGTAENAFVRGWPAAAPGASQSIARHPDGADTCDNSFDFTVGVPSPGAPNP